jgi:tRNA (guanine26-N2/guanine27-N2)-dimethyltransferase
MCITSTDGRTLCGIQPDAAYAWYGCMPLNTTFTHEFGIRTLLTTLVTTAARYKRSIEPLICLSANFYFRIFVRIHDKPLQTKRTSSFTDIVLFSQDTSSFWLQPLGSCTIKGSNAVVRPAVVGDIPSRDPYTDSALKLGGPVYAGPLHNKDFIERVLEKVPYMKYIHTQPRIEGVLNTCLSEIEAPFYYDLSALAGIIKSSCPSRDVVVSALERIGFQCSLSHCRPGVLKTDAPSEAVWDCMRAWYFKEGKKLPEQEGIAKKILAHEPKYEVNLEVDEEVSKRLKKEKKICRFYENPEANFGPKPAANKKKSPKDKKNKK